MFSPPNFVPSNAVAGVSLTIGAASANVQVPQVPGSNQAALSLLNIGTAVTFFRYGNSNGVTALATDQAIGPNERLIIPIPVDYVNGNNPQLWVAAIGSVGPILYINVGTYS